MTMPPSTGHEILDHHITTLCHLHKNTTFYLSFGRMVFILQVKSREHLTKSLYLDFSFNLCLFLDRLTFPQHSRSVFLCNNSDNVHSPTDQPPAASETKEPSSQPARWRPPPLGVPWAPIVFLQLLLLSGASTHHSQKQTVL